MITIHCEITIHAPVERCFDLMRSVDLHADSSTAIGARAMGGRCSGLSGEGDTTVWSARFFRLRFSMTTRVEDYAFPIRFNDRMTRGLLRRFGHVYRLSPLPEGGCAVSDELVIEAPFGLPGRLMEKFYLSHRMQHLVRQRLVHIKRVAEGEDWRYYVADTDGRDRAMLPPNPEN